MIIKEEWQNNKKCNKCHLTNLCKKPCSYLKNGSAKERREALEKKKKAAR